jgi:restriction endonuclease Mrr
VQCKKYSVRDITETDIRSFLGSVSIEKYSKYKENTKLYFITTSKFTAKAKEFAKESKINAIDFEQIYKLQEIYSLNIFRKELLQKE